MQFVKISCYLIFLYGFSIGLAGAQELAPPDSNTDTTASEPANNSNTSDNSDSNSVTPDAFINDSTLPFNGTLDDAYQKEDQLFGTPTNETPPETEAVNGPNAVLKFEFVSYLQFVNPGDPSPYIEIQYTNQFEVPVLISPTKQDVETTINIDAQNWGSLAQNEFFECHLNIPGQQYPASLSLKLNTKASENEGEEASRELIMRISFNEPLLEPWFAFCSDTTGHTLNTQGAPEEYNMQIIKMIDPPLSSLLISDFNPDVATKINLSVPQKIEDDTQLNNTLFLSGEGNITLSPLE